MNKIIPCITFSLLFFFSFSTSASAQGIAQLSGCTGVDCTACNVVYLANGGITWLIGILFVVFALLLAIAGVKLVTSGGNHHALDEAKSSFMNAIIGFIIILSAWLLVDTVMRTLVGSAGREGQIGQIGTGGTVTGWLFWSEVVCQSQTDTASTTVTQEAVVLLPTELRDEATADSSYAVSRPIGGGSVGGGSVGGGGNGPGPTTSGANCPVPAESTMVTIPGTSFKARPDVASNFARMRTAAAADGISLVITSGWRSEATQVEIWRRKGCVANPGNCSGKAARPCTYGGNGSNHNSGNALDISTPMNGPVYNWLKANGGRYGFYNTIGARDPVHWSKSGR